MSEDAISPEVLEFQKGRSRAVRQLYNDFIRARGLDMDDKYWTPAERAEYRVLADALIAEWSERQRTLLASLNPDTPEGD